MYNNIIFNLANANKKINILNILRCGKKCICYMEYQNNRYKFSENELKQLNSTDTEKYKWCFTNYDGIYQFKKFQLKPKIEPKI